jgi:hypothetical protein
MDLDSPIFDRIRVRPRAEETHGTDAPQCQHQGCTQAGDFRAPKGRGQEGRFWHFCLDHVRAYNQTYNYFAGMPDDDILAYQKAATIGHRPTWTMGVNPSSPRRSEARGSAPPGFEDPFDVLGAAHGYRRHQRPAEPEGRRIKMMERRAFEALDLAETANAADIKSRYKTLVKRLHPDANGGDRSSEEKLRGIIQAYNTLRSAGFC